MKPLSELQQGDYVEYVHNTGKIKKGFTIGKSYPVLKVKEYLGASYEFILMSDEGVRRTFKTSTDQFKYIHPSRVVTLEEIRNLNNTHFTNEGHTWPELNKMSPSDLLALRIFIEEMINFYDVEYNAMDETEEWEKSLSKSFKEKTKKWSYHLTIVQQHIDKSTAHYFGEESKS